MQLMAFQLPNLFVLTWRLFPSRMGSLYKRIIVELQLDWVVLWTLFQLVSFSEMTPLFKIDHYWRFVDWGYRFFEIFNLSHLVLAFYSIVTGEQTAEKWVGNVLMVGGTLWF